MSQPEERRGAQGVLSASLRMLRGQYVAIVSADVMVDGALVADICMREDTASASGGVDWINVINVLSGKSKLDEQEIDHIDTTAYESVVTDDGEATDADQRKGMGVELFILIFLCIIMILSSCPPEEVRATTSVGVVTGRLAGMDSRIEGSIVRFGRSHREGGAVPRRGRRHMWRGGRGDIPAEDTEDAREDEMAAGMDRDRLRNAVLPYTHLHGAHAAHALAAR